MEREDRPAVVVSPQRSSQHALFGFLALVPVAALVSVVVRGTAEGVGGAVLLGVLVLAAVGAGAFWVTMVRHPVQLSVTPTRICLHRRPGDEEGPVLHRADGDRLLLELGGTARARHLDLTNTAGEVRLSLQLFDAAEVEGVCRAAGWRVGGPSDEARIVAVLDEVAERLGRPDADLRRASFVDAEAAVAEVRALRDQVAAGEGIGIGLGPLFAPTGPVQEAAVDSGWGDRFVVLAAELDAARANLAGATRRRGRGG